MTGQECPTCGTRVEENVKTCPVCGKPVKSVTRRIVANGQNKNRGFQWQTKATILGWPLIHVAFGRDKETGRLLVAKGFIAVGQFGVGVITLAQFGIGFLFGFGQVMAGYFLLGHIALALKFGIGQVATGYTAIGQLAAGKYVLAQVGFGTYLWTSKVKDPEAVRHFMSLWTHLKEYIPQCMRDLAFGG